MTKVRDGDENELLQAIKMDIEPRIKAHKLVPENASLPASFFASDVLEEEEIMPKKPRNKSADRP